MDFDAAFERLLGHEGYAIDLVRPASIFGRNQSDGGQPREMRDQTVVTGMP